MDNLDFNLEETEKKGDIYFSNNVTDSAADKKTILRLSLFRFHQPLNQAMMRLMFFTKTV